MINWKVRLKNKTWLLAFVMAIVAFVYQMLGLFGVALPVSEGQLSQIIGIVINLLVAMGIVVDPTTKGICDSECARKYSEPH